MNSLFRENLREELAFQGISAKELAEKTQIPYQSLANYLNARASMPPADYACRIARALNTTVEKLVGEGNLPPNEYSRQDARIVAQLNTISSENKQAFIQLISAIAAK